MAITEGLRKSGENWETADENWWKNKWTDETSIYRKIDEHWLNKKNLMNKPKGNDEAIDEAIKKLIYIDVTLVWH